MFKTKTAILIGIIVFTVLAMTDVSGRPSHAELENKRITISVKSKPLHDVFFRLTQDYDIAIGFEQSNLDDGYDYYVFETNIQYDKAMGRMPDGTPIANTGNRPVVEDHFISIDYQNARLKDVLDDVVAQMKNYTWRVDNDVVNIFPLKGREPKFVRLLDTKISKFTAPIGLEVGHLEALIILDLPEFKTFTARNGLYAEAWHEGSWGLTRPLSEAMSFSDLTFRDLLNGITKAKRGGWILKRGDPKIYESPSGEKKEFIELEI